MLPFRALEVQEVRLQAMQPHREVKQRQSEVREEHPLAVLPFRALEVQEERLQAMQPHQVAKQHQPVVQVEHPFLAWAALEVVQVVLPCRAEREVRLPEEQRCQPLPLRA